MVCLLSYARTLAFGVDLRNGAANNSKRDGRVTRERNPVIASVARKGCAFSSMFRDPCELYISILDIRYFFLRFSISRSQAAILFCSSQMRWKLSSKNSSG